MTRFSRVPVGAAASRDLGATELRVLVALCSRADAAGVAWPGYAYLAKCAGVDRRKIAAALAKIEGAGFIARQRRKTEFGDDDTTRYAINYEQGVTPDEGLGDTSPGVTPDTSPGATGDTSGGARVTPPGVSGVTPDEGLGVTPPEVPYQTNGSAQLISPAISSRDQTDSRPSAHSLDLAFDAWNAMAERIGLERVKKHTPARRRALTARIRDAGGIEGWRAALAKVEASPFLRGEANGRDHPGWRADFDFIVRESSFVKLLEGRYDARPGPGPRGRVADGIAAGLASAAAREDSAATIDGTAEEIER